MTVHLSVNENGRLKMTSGPSRVRKDSVEKYLGRNDDAILVKLNGVPDQSMDYKPGHVCRIEEDDEDSQLFNVFVGNHYLGSLPEEALEFSRKVDMYPPFFPSIVGKVEDGNIYIYIAE